MFPPLAKSQGFALLNPLQDASTGASFIQCLLDSHQQAHKLFDINLRNQTGWFEQLCENLQQTHEGPR